METTQGSTTTTATPPTSSAQTETSATTAQAKEEQGTAQGSTEQAQSQTAPQIKKFKLKVDGDDFEEEIDLSNEAELVKRFQLAKAAEKRISQSKAEKQKAMEILKAFEDGTLLKKHPKSRELAEKFLLEQLEDEMLTPEQKEYKQLKAFKEQKEREEAESKKAEAEAIAKQREQSIAQQFQKTIIDALDKSGLPKTPDLAKRMATIMKKNLDLGLDLTSDDLVAEVKSEANAMLKALVGSASGDQLIALLGEDVAKKIRAYDVQRLKSQTGTQPKKEPSVKSPKSEDGRPLTLDEWKEQVRQRVKS